ncbi:GNAT family N-acetyltransferase [soil metagenome]
MAQIPTLETSRLLLRPIQMSDAPRIQELFSNPNVLRYMYAGIPFPYPENGAVEFLERTLPKVEAGEEYLWAILRKDHPGEAMIGQISLTPLSDVDHRGFWLGEPYWRQGYMNEAAAAVNDFAFDVLGMEHLLLNNAEPNLGSHRLKEISGAEIIGREEKPFIGGTFPSVRWRLDADAWRANRASFLNPA